MSFWHHTLWHPTTASSQQCIHGQSGFSAYVCWCCVVFLPNKSSSAPAAVSARPYSPERPPTPSSRPARRRQLMTDANQDAVLQPPVLEGWAASNDVFAHMRQQRPHEHLPQQMTEQPSWGASNDLCSLPVRPATAGASDATKQMLSTLSWTGSMQLPAGLLKLVAQPQHQCVERKAKHEYDWGFGNGRGLV